MDFTLDKKHEMARSLFREFAENEVKPLAQETDETEQFPAETVKKMAKYGFMGINIPGTWFGWWSDEAFALYLIVDTILVMLYCAIWIICFKKNSVFRALALSIIPSMLFLFSGIMSRSVLLIIASVLFTPSHIVISYKNVK